MADQVSLSGPVHIESGSAERVAFDLMKEIDYYLGNETSRKDEKYWLRLFLHCRRVVVNGQSVESATKD
jgi:hypothetical protein